ncbi:MAG: DUF2798 domain-containing protein [Clostridia bacterium]|nr:DUF2798 domain-containing protein [Clostridia bacterium]NCC42834.1 DUF2798 domain-containing protein [Clostridia bacterium]
MPKNRVQETIFTIMMVFVMVYAMIIYNITIERGSLTNDTFLIAFHELIFMEPIAFILDTFIVGGLAKMFTFRMFNPREDKQIFIVLSISVFSVMFMCPLMSLAATIIIKQAFHFDAQFIATWIYTTIKNFPMAFFWQLCFAGPVVRFLFGLIFRDDKKKA